MRLTPFALLVALTLPAAAQQRRAMTPDDVMAMKNVSDAQISPDGKWVAYVVSAADLKESAYNTDIWLVPAAGGTPLRLTSSPKADGQPRWRRADRRARDRDGSSQDGYARLRRDQGRQRDRDRAAAAGRQE